MRTVRSFGIAVVLFVLLFGTTSCHRGYGCPGEFSTEDFLTQAINQILSIL